MTKEQFRLFKQRLYQSLNGLENSVQTCPELEEVYIVLPDGHKLFAHEMILWLRAVRSECWKYGPADIQVRHIKERLKGQPRG
jgi:hypothetical protein